MQLGMPPEGELDVLAIGETVIDLISTEPVDTLREAAHFRRFQGGSPANIAANVRRLGGKAALVSKIGADGFGDYAVNALKELGLTLDYVVRDPSVRTSVVFITRSAGTPAFSAYRDADRALRPEEVAEEAIQRARIVHTSAFALSVEPCRSAVTEAFRRAHRAGKWLSLDPNYRPSLWVDRREARAVLEELYAYATFTKPSLDDAIALFDEELSPEKAVERFHGLGCPVVVLTMGQRGSLVSDGDRIEHVPARALRIADTTGAGDAFWAGFLMALLDGITLADAARVAREVVELKLQTVGPLVQSIDRASLYARLLDSADEERLDAADSGE